MKFRRPSPSMVVALIALVLSTSGSAVAAVSYASRAGSVDGHSAVGASSSLQARGRNLVATAKGGPMSGQIPAKFLAGMVRARGSRSCRRCRCRTTPTSHRSRS